MNRTPPQELSQARKDTLLRFWKIAQELHGFPTDDFVPSKSRTFALIRLLDRAGTEAEAVVRMRTDREGTLGLAYATHCSACMNGFVLSNADITSADKPQVQVWGSAWYEHGMPWFCRECVRDGIPPFGMERDASIEEIS